MDKPYRYHEVPLLYVLDTIDQVAEALEMEKSVDSAPRGDWRRQAYGGCVREILAASGWSLDEYKVMRTDSYLD